MFSNVVNIGLYLIPMRSFDQNSPRHKTRFSVYEVEGISSHSQLSIYDVWRIIRPNGNRTFIRWRLFSVFVNAKKNQTAGWVRYKITLNVFKNFDSCEILIFRDDIDECVHKTVGDPITTVRVWPSNTMGVCNNILEKMRNDYIKLRWLL